MLFYFLMKSATLSSINVDPIKIQVSYLKKLISDEINTTEDNIILIANGGLSIQDGVLGNYNCADNEGNPVFVYIRQIKRTTCDIIGEEELNSEYFKYTEKLKILINKTGNNFSILQENETLSASILESCKRIDAKIKTEIRNQFLVVDGWSAALANLYDSLSSVERRINAMNSNLDKFFSNDLEVGFEIMEKFNDSKEKLEKVPLLPVLCDGSENCETERQNPTNLLQWVLSHDSRARPQVTVQSIISEAYQAYNDLMGIEDGVQVDLSYLKENWGKIGMIANAYKHITIGRGLIEQGKPMQSIVDEDLEEVEKFVPVEKETHTSIKGYLGRLDCLTGVREMCEKAVASVQTVKEYMENTVRRCRDSVGHAVLADHCAGARSQLENISKQYTLLRENLKKIERSKVDMTSNIDSRKTWLQQFQTKICEVDDSLFLVKEKMKRVRTGIRVLNQMHTAPEVYARGVAEIARRQIYLDFWYDWGMQSSKFAQEIRRKDQEARMLLEQDFENHFIQSLFNSLYSFSLPKLGASLLQSSRPALPVVTNVDLENLAEHLPHFRHILTVSKIDQNTFMESSLDNDQMIVDEPLLELNAMKYQVRVSSEEVSLLPVPDDPNIRLEMMNLSQPGQKVNDQATNSDSVSNLSSKMVKSIDSMDFQLTNDAATETRKDIICVSRSLVESLMHNIQELKSKLDTVKSDVSLNVDEQKKSHEQILNLVITLSNQSILQQEAPPEPLLNTTKSCNTDFPNVTGASNMFQMVHKDFIQGDHVCFYGNMINDTMQWRMLTTDNRIYFLHDNSFTTPPVNRRTRRESNIDQGVLDVQSTESSVMALSQTVIRPRSVAPMVHNSPIVKGTFISKEEYKCRKTSNRYGLPIDTKFFRVQANVDWGSNRPTNTN